MARTSEMRLVELMILNQDITPIIEYLGKCGNFQFQTEISSPFSADSDCTDSILYDELQKARIFLNIEDREAGIIHSDSITDTERTAAIKTVAAVKNLSERIEAETAAFTRISSALKEALAFSNLQVSYSELEHLSFLNLRIGRITADEYDGLKSVLNGLAVVVPLGEDNTRILVAASKKNRFAMDTELKKAGFVNLEIPVDFKGIPEDVIAGLKSEKFAAEKKLNDLNEEKNNFAETHKDLILHLLEALSVSIQIETVKKSLQSTSLVYRVAGWIPADEGEDFIKAIDEISEGRCAVRKYLPHEVAAVISGEEEVPVKLKHGKFVESFEKMIFSYGSPVYGSIDPTPFVAVFFTLLFGIMFGDFGQGLIFLFTGILMAKKVIKVGSWNKFAPIFIAIGVSSSLMGLLTGEFFGTEKILEPFSIFVTGLFGTPRHQIIHVMPSSDPNSIKIMFGVFGFAVAVGFVINSVGLILNILNKFMHKEIGSALFGKTGLAGAMFFWYVVVLAIRAFAFSYSPAFYDWIVIGLTLFFAAFGHPFERILDKKRPIAENGFGAMLIGGIVELIEVISTYISNSVSFMRVGAFALSHAVLGYIISTMAALCPPAGKVLVLIAGNAIVVVLEGMIVAIQVVRLQYYEFFSKFFSETGREFRPFSFEYK